MTTLNDLSPDSNRINPVSGRPLPKHMANPHTNVDIIHGGGGGGGGEAAFVAYTGTHDVRSIDNGQTAFYDITLPLDDTSQYSFTVAGYVSEPMAFVRFNYLGGGVLRLEVENQSGQTIPQTTVKITATQLF
ncbi:hypothetical protein GCM10009007_03260 [Formosimonas limnophila]|uniref:Uncharacterized protein n=1 Tax=Formosimonas limnophila TaxID=1384487 RepID=A0A8J3CLZ2_9BURK|nr:hypothetical protein [Formosimonas limnophila]GHA66154.1 hypothetical protein GCM10009007_03260 [Formosimonas limnophila]